MVGMCLVPVSSKYSHENECGLSDDAQDLEGPEAGAEDPGYALALSQLKKAERTSKRLRNGSVGVWVFHASQPLLEGWKMIGTSMIRIG